MISFFGYGINIADIRRFCFDLHSIALLDNLGSAEGNEPEKMEEDDDELDLLSDDDGAKLTDGPLTVVEKKNKKKTGVELC